MTRSQPTKGDLIELKVEALYGDETFDINNAVFNKLWKEDCNSLLLKLCLEAFEHFIDVDQNLLNNCESIDLLIESNNECLMTSLEERTFTI